VHNPACSNGVLHRLAGRNPKFFEMFFIGLKKDVASTRLFFLPVSKQDTNEYTGELQTFSES